MKNTELPHPIFKWAGGKSALIPTFESNDLIPQEFGRYFEPFFGAGAMFFHLWNEKLIDKATISDINSDLYNVYNLIKYRCSELIEFSYDMKLSPDGPTYYRNRKRFNDLKFHKLKNSSLDERCERAILMIYLNKTGYSGMYRENKNGIFNVPCGYYNNPTIIDVENLYSVSDSLKNVTIRNHDYKKIIPEKPNSGDFVYLDPPYMPYGTVSNFRDYHHTGFDNNEQRILCGVYHQLTAKGVKVLLSNSSNPELNEMYLQGNPNLRIVTVPAQRLINQKNVGRVLVDEFAILNYK